jgi:single-stranded-DNA-specific exonuclease
MGIKKWQILGKIFPEDKVDIEKIILLLMQNRGITANKDILSFLNPPLPSAYTPEDVGIESTTYTKAIERINKAINDKESIVVYADYDADGITAGSIMWDAIHHRGGNIMPYIPSRSEEGYGLSQKGLDTVKEKFNPTLLITVDHGITAREKVTYANKLGIEVIVTDHHVKPELLPDCLIVHTTQLSGAGIAWYLAKEITKDYADDLLVLATIGTIADMVPLTAINRSLAKWGLSLLNKTNRVGIRALIEEAGLTNGSLGTYDISHVLAPRLNAMGRLTHAMDALRLLCTTNTEKAKQLAKTLGTTNKERQQLTADTTVHAIGAFKSLSIRNMKKLLFISHETYNQGVIGLVAGKLVEEYFRPAVVVSRGEKISKASARSIPGFNIVEAIRKNSDILIDVGGHPMAAGFTIETQMLELLQSRLEHAADLELDDVKLTRSLRIDTEIPLSCINMDFWVKLQEFEPFGFGNPEPVFATNNVLISDFRTVGADGKHLKLKVSDPDTKIVYDAIAFGMGIYHEQINRDSPVNIVYTIDRNEWNGKVTLQLKIKDIIFPQ